jgi:hypothetical protein
MEAAPFLYDCDVEGGFAMDPNEHPRIGYVVLLNGFGLSEALKPDLNVAVPYNSATLEYKSLVLAPPTAKDQGGKLVGPSTTKVVGVLDNFEWNGGTCDPIKLEFTVSQQNANAINSLLQAGVKDTLIKSLAWWICDYDVELKCWFEQAHVLGAGTITGHINKRKEPALSVEMKPVEVGEGLGVKVYKVKLDVVPAGQEKYRLHFATTRGQKVVRIWGVLIG